MQILQLILQLQQLFLTDRIKNVHTLTTLEKNTIHQGSSVTKYHPSTH